MERKPKLIPSTSGKDLRNPKLTPEAKSRKLPGPGEIDMTKAKPTKARILSSDKRLSSYASLANFKPARAPKG
jgi:hypothetical protein